MSLDGCITGVRDHSVDLENALTACQATGVGIKEKYLSIQDKLPTDIQHKIQRCNHLRNRVMHDKYNLTADEYQQYDRDMCEVLGFLHKISASTQSTYSSNSSSSRTYTHSYSSDTGSTQLLEECVIIFFYLFIGYVFICLFVWVIKLLFGKVVAGVVGLLILIGIICAIIYGIYYYFIKQLN